MMTIYPIELSTQLKQLIESNTLVKGLSLTEESVENCWVKAIAFLALDDKNRANKLLKNLENDATFGLASQVELIINKPIDYFDNKKLISDLTKQSTTLPNERQLARLLHALAILMLWRRNTPKALKHLHQSRSIYRSLNEDVGLSRILDTLGNVMLAIADQEQAMLYYVESLAIKTSLNDIEGQAITLGNLARLCLQFGRYQQARSFASLDLKLCNIEDIETRALLFNLLARINIADEQIEPAEKQLNTALNLLDNKASDTFFFCLKDLALLKIKQGAITDAEKLYLDLSTVTPKKSLYHQLQRKIILHKLLADKDELKLSVAELLLEDIENLDIPELALEYRVWLTQLAVKQNNKTLAQHHLLLSRKKARKHGLKRFIPQITSLMLTMKIAENIQEETVRPITDDLAQVEDGYLIRKKLGHGGFGEVFLAHDMTHDRDVAIKRFYSDNLIDHRQQNKIWDQARLEFEAVASTNHPCIAKTYALGHDSIGNPYLVQEFIAGGDISHLMHKSPDLTNALIYLIPVTRALAALHESGVIHRDVKPENMLINSQGNTVLIDFGIALLKQSCKNNQNIQGSEHYIAPEQRLTTNISFKADLYSLGCVLYQWLTGEHYVAKAQPKNKISSWLGMENKKESIFLDKNSYKEANPLLAELLAYHAENRPDSASAVADKMEYLLSTLT